MLDITVKDAIRTNAYASLMETLGSRIRQLREAQGMTQDQLAKLLSVTKGAVSQWELGGTKNIKLVTFQQLLGVLHTSADYLLFGKTSAASIGRHRALRRPET